MHACRAPTVLVSGGDLVRTSGHGQLGAGMEILQTVFRDVRIPTECTLHKMVLISKDNEELLEIDIAEVLWKDFWEGQIGGFSKPIFFIS